MDPSGGQENPAFVADTTDTNQVTVIHTNPAAPDSPRPLHISESSPTIQNNPAVVVNKSESLGDVNSTNEDRRVPPSYGSQVHLIDAHRGDSSESLGSNNPSTNDPSPSPPPQYNNYTTNITIGQPPPPPWTPAGADEEKGKANGLEKQAVDEDGKPAVEEDETATDRDLWGRDIEFLLSCIAMSVGLGNVWRFPFIALANGGGAFVIPYIITLIVVGKPIYYLEMLVGQFASRGSVKVYDCAPGMRGTGWGQLVALLCIMTFYSSLMAIIGSYLFDSFYSPLPWADCRSDWPENCIPSGSQSTPELKPGQNYTPSSEYYFVREILHEPDDGIDDGIGWPSGRLTIFLAISWILVCILLVRGVKSSGKAAYFLAIFPYIVMIILFIRAVTLPGATRGLTYFFKPQWDKLADPDVWYNAVTQVFFSLSVCFGNVIMYASYNKFRHNVSTDATIITTIDTFTSLLAGSTVFGILGHLAEKVGADDVGTVVRGGPGLAFISYPDAIAKFEWFPQGFSFLFFIMLYVLGIGSNVGMTSCIMTIIRDEFPRIKHWQCTIGIGIFGFCVALVYITPGGQYVLELVDHHGAQFVAFILAICELVAFGWIYGVKRLSADVYFMLGFKPNIVWRWCWQWITPIFMLAILIYTLINLKPAEYNGYHYTFWAYFGGWCITALGLSQIPIWMLVAFMNSGNFVRSFKPLADWGPGNPVLLRKYKEYIASLDLTTWQTRASRRIFGKNA